MFGVRAPSRNELAAIGRTIDRLRIFTGRGCPAALLNPIFTLFNGFLSAADHCASCGLDYSPFQAGDGPTALVILVVGAISLVAMLLGRPPSIRSIGCMPLYGTGNSTSSL